MQGVVDILLLSSLTVSQLFAGLLSLHSSCSLEALHTDLMYINLKPHLHDHWQQCMFICNSQLLSIFFLSCLLPILISDVFPLPLSWQVEEYSDCSINFSFDIIWDIICQQKCCGFPRQYVYGPLINLNLYATSIDKLKITFEKAHQLEQSKEQQSLSINLPVAQCYSYLPCMVLTAGMDNQ